MKTTKALQGGNFFAHQDQAKQVPTRSQHRHNPTKLRTVQTTPHHNLIIIKWFCSPLHPLGFSLRILGKTRALGGTGVKRTVDQMTSPCRSKRHLAARTGQIDPPLKDWGLCLLTLAHFSLGVSSNKAFTLLPYCVSAFQFFVSSGTRNENKLDP